MTEEARVFDINEEEESMSPVAKLNKPAIKIENLSVTTKKNDFIIKNLSFEAKFGEILAIMGPSGCGKSTLLRYIADIKSRSLSYIGNKVVVGKFKFVSQEDYLHSFLTIEDYLNNYFGLNYGKLRDPAEISSQQQDIEKVLSIMNLSKSRKTKVGDVFQHGLSGGEKRRLSIALELLSNPAILVIDEPTSGLDSFSAERLVNSLKDLVHMNKVCVIISIHQPSSRVFKFLDKILLIKKGQLYYHGPRVSMKRFFEVQGEGEWENYNEADQAIELLCRDDVKPVAQKSRFSSDQVRIDQIRVSRKLTVRGIELKIRRKSTNWEKFLFITKRNLLSIAFNPAVLGIRVLMYLTFSILLGSLFYDLESLTSHESVISRISLIKSVQNYYVLMSLAALPSFIMERAIFENEIRNKLYHPFLYQYSKWLTSWIGVGFFTITTAVFILPLSTFNGAGYFMVILFITLLLSEGVATLVSIIVPHYIIGMAVIASLYGFFMLCDGFLILREDMPKIFVWGYYVAFHTYAFRAFMHNEFASISSFSGSLFQNGKQVLASYDMIDVNMAQELLILIAYIIIVQILTSILLKLKYKF